MMRGRIQIYVVSSCSLIVVLVETWIGHVLKVIDLGADLRLAHRIPLRLLLLLLLRLRSTAPSSSYLAPRHDSTCSLLGKLRGAERDADDIDG